MSIYSLTETDNHARVGVTSTSKQYVEAGNQSTASTNAGEGSCLHAIKTAICRPNAGVGCLQATKAQVHQNKAVNTSGGNNISHIATYNDVTMAARSTKSELKGVVISSRISVLLIPGLLGIPL